MYRFALQQLEEIIVAAKERDIKVIGVVFPQSPEYARTGAFGRHGMRRSTAIKILDEIAQLDSTYSNFTFMDENKMGAHDYEDWLAYDYDHLNVFGSFIISKRIDSVMVSTATSKAP